VIVPPLPERTLAESAGAALAVGGGGALGAGAASAALAERGGLGGAALVAQRCAALRRFGARCAVHPLLRSSPALDAFLRTTDEEVRQSRLVALFKLY
jgi:hypothetical protein